MLSLPMVFIWMAGREVGHERMRLQNRDLERKLEEVLLTAEGELDPLSALMRRIRYLERQAFQTSRPLSMLQKMVNQLHREFPGMLEFTVLDGKGEPIPILCAGSPPKAVLRRFFERYKQFCQGDRFAMLGVENMMRSFFGPFVPIHQDLQENAWSGKRIGKYGSESTERTA